jgi:hypothetical protein
MTSRSKRKVRKQESYLGFCELWVFRKRLKKKQDEILAQNNERIRIGQQLNDEHLVVLNPILDTVQSRIFSYVFWRILILILFGSIFLLVRHVEESNIMLKCNVNSIRFYTSKEIQLSSKYDRIEVGNFIKLSKKWSVIQDLFPEEYEDLLLQNRAIISPIQIRNLTIPAGSYVTMHYNQSGELEIKSEFRDTTSQTDLVLTADSTLLYKNLTIPLESRFDINANSGLGYRFSKVVMSEPDISLHQVVMDSIFLVQYRTMDGGASYRSPSILDGEVNFTEYSNRRYTLNEGDTLAVEFDQPIYVNLQINNNKIQINTQVVAKSVLAGKSFGNEIDDLDLTPTKFEYCDSSMTSEWKNLVLTLILSIVTFLFIRQRKDL